mmetsp:Transcript_32104/g.42577  ORF Transcript_32104/g.42577 Transcript_32104/m.42577 type:complete len:108 (-) Transcript_32104:90-413(-)
MAVCTFFAGTLATIAAMVEFIIPAFDSLQAIAVATRARPYIVSQVFFVRGRARTIGVYSDDIDKWSLSPTAEDFADDADFAIEHGIVLGYPIIVVLNVNHPTTNADS